MTISNVQSKALAEPFPKEVLSILNKGGAKLTYIPVSESVARLNDILGAGNWSIIASEAWRDEVDTEWIIAKVTIEATIDGNKATRIGFGGQKIKQMKAGGPVDLGDEFKGAASDAMKKAATLFGVGLDLARSEEALTIEADKNVEKMTDHQKKVIDHFAATGSEEGIADFKTWWKSNVGKKLDSGSVTFEEAANAVDFISGLES